MTGETEAISDCICTRYVFGHEIYKRRKELKMSPTTLAKMVNSCRTKIYDIEKGEPAERSLLRAICDVLELDFDELLDAEEEAISREAMKVRESRSTSAEEKSFLRTLIAWYEQPKNRNFVKRALKCIFIATAIFVSSNAVVQAITGENIFKFMGRVGNAIVYQLNGDDSALIDTEAEMTEVGTTDEYIIEVAEPDKIQQSEIAEKFDGDVYLPSWIPDGYALLDVIYNGVGGINRAKIVYYNAAMDNSFVFTMTEHSDEVQSASVKILTAEDAEKSVREVTLGKTIVSILIHETEEENVFSVATMVFNDVLYTFSYFVETDVFLEVVENMELCK